MGFFKGSQKLQRNSEYRSNDPWTRCTSWMRKKLRNPFACNADHRFDTKVICPTRRGSFWVKFPTVRNKTPVKCPGYGKWGWADLELTGTLLCFNEFTSKYNIFIFSIDISGSQDGSIRMWEFGHSQEITSHHTSGSYQRVTRARFSPHGNKVILMLY